MNYIAPLNGILSDEWVKWVASNYSLLIVGIPVFLTALVKLLAIIHPNVPSDKILDWIKETFTAQK